MQHQRGKLDEAIALMERMVAIEEALHHPDLEDDRRILARWQRERDGGGAQGADGPAT